MSEIFKEEDLELAIKNMYKHKEFLTIQDIQRIFNVPYITAYRWVVIYNYFSYTKVGKFIYVSKQSVIDYIQKNNGLNRKKK